LGVFFPTDNALYSIAFGTRTNTAEPIEMPFGIMTQVGSRYHVLDGRPDPTRGRGNFLGENAAANCREMGHFMVRYAKTAEPIDMPFCMKTQVGPWNHVLDGVQIPKGRDNFGGFQDHSKALAMLAAGLLPTAEFAAAGII